MLLVAVSSARFARRNLDFIPFWAVSGGFLLLSAAEPSMKSSSSLRAPGKLVSATVASLMLCDHTQSSIASETTTTTAAAAATTTTTIDLDTEMEEETGPVQSKQTRRGCL